MGRDSPVSATRNPFARALAHYQAGRHAAAARLCRRILGRRPHDRAALHLLATIATAEGRHARAIQLHRKAVAAAPDEAAGHHQLGLALRAAGRPQDAVGALERATTLAPDDAALWSNLGISRKDAGRPEAAIAALARAAELAPGEAEIRYNLGNALLAADRPAAAAEAFEYALARAPDHLHARIHLGTARKEAGQPAAAVAALRHAVAMAPDCADAHWNLALALLLAGDWEAGWREYEWRRRLPGFAVRALPGPSWDGSPLGGRTLLVHAEQGLGDSLQFVRLLAAIPRAGGRVVLQCPGRMTRLLAGCAGLDDIVADEAPAPDHDCHVPLLSLPGLLSPAPAGGPPYLAPEAARVRRWAAHLAPAGGCRVGLAWQGNPAYAADRRRSIPAAALAPLGKVAGARLYSLQKDAGPAPAGVRELGPALDGDGHAFIDSAAVIANLDLVITSDTAIAHLAGALGAEVWLLLAHVPDWRWGLVGERTPWYPTMRLFRQTRPGDWAGVVGRAAHELERRTTCAQEHEPIRAASGRPS